MSAWRDAKNAFDKCDEALTQAIARGDKAEAARLSEELQRRANDFTSIPLPDDPAEQTEGLMASIERFRANDMPGVTMTEGQRSSVIRALENGLERIRKPLA